MSRQSKNRSITLFAIGAALALIAAIGLGTASGGDPEPQAGGASNDITALWQPQLLVQIRVSDLDRSIAFYRDTLGFELHERIDELKWAKVRSPVQNVSIGLGVAPDAPGSGGMSLNFTVADIDKAREILESKGVQFAGPTMTVPDKVRLADFKDPDGNRIRLAGAPN